MKVGTAAKVFLGKNELVKEFSGIQIGTDVILGKAEGRTKDLSGLVLSNYLMLGKGISRAVIATVYGVPPLSLPDAIDSSLYSLTAFGGTETVAETYIDEVTADGKCEQNNLPSGYTELEYIQSSGTQYINTEVSGNATIKITAQASTIKGSSQALLSSTPTAQGGTWFGEFTTNQKWGIGSGGGLTTIDPTTKMTAEITFDGSGCSGTVNGESITRSATITQGSWTIGAGVSGTTLNYPFSGKVWGCQITQNGVLVRNFIPCKNSSNVVGMYDTVSGTFFTNAGTGDFIAGNAATPTPDTPIDIVCNNGVLKARHQSGLPLGYTLLDYIESSGTQYIRTSANIKNTSKIKIVAQMLGTSGVLIGSNRNGSAPSLSIVCAGQFFWGSSSPSFAADLNKHTYYVDVNKLYIDDVLKATASGTWSDSHIIPSLGLFTVDQGTSVLTGYNSTARCYSLQIWDNDVLQMNMVPAKDSNNVVGMYDLVSGQFFTNAGTGTFTAGNPASDPIEIYTDGTVETVTDALSNTATCERLLSVGDYKDTQEILSGAVTRNVGIKVLDGTENWNISISIHDGVDRNNFYMLFADAPSSDANNVICSIAQSITTTTSGYSAPICRITSSKNFNIVPYEDITTMPNVTAWTNYLKAQYNAGTPVIIVYPLATATTATATAQSLVKEPVTATGSLSNLVVTAVSSSHTVPTPAQPLDINTNNGVLKWDDVNQSIYTDGTQETINIHTKNLFDEQWNRNTGVSTQTATWGQVVYANGWSTSGLVPVKAGQQYTVSYNTTTQLYVFYYESDGTMQQSYDFTTATKKTFTVPAGATHIRLQVNKSTEAAIANLETQLETGATATTHVPYYNGGTAVAEMLLSVGTYTDEQEVISGGVTRKVGVKVLDGTEGWTQSAATTNLFYATITGSNTDNTYIPYSTHFEGVAATTGYATMTDGQFKHGSNTNSWYFKNTDCATATAFSQWLAAQYAAGTPVIVVYPLATETAETVTGQPMSTTEGDNIAEITQASLDNLELQVTYMAGVSLTIEEVEDAQLSPDVEVTIQ